MCEMDVRERVTVSTHSEECMFRVRCISDYLSATVTSALRAAKAYRGHGAESIHETYVRFLPASREAVRRLAFRVGYVIVTV